MWKLTPQPVIEEYKEFVELQIVEGDFDNIKKEHFHSFEKGKHITWQQWLILRAVEKGLHRDAQKRISVRSGHGIGKSTVLAWLIIWFLFCYKDAQVPCTAPTSEQIHDVLWKEISVWLEKMPVPIKAKFDYTVGYLRIKDRPRSWFARARTARKENPEALAGVHSEFVMMCIDEGSGVPNEIFKVAEGALTNEDVLVVMISNPTRTEGYFYDTQHIDNVAWQNLGFNSEDSPIVSKEYIKRMEEKYGRDSDEFKIRVSGEFPQEGIMDEQGYVPLINKNQIIKVSVDIPFTGRVKMGVDPSGEGDDQTAWIQRDNFIAKIMATEKTSNPKGIAHKTITLKELNKIDGEDIICDNFGEGANVPLEIMSASNDNLHIKGVNWGEKADDEEVYANKRAECYFRAREWLIKGGMLLDDILIDEMTKIKYRRTISGKLIIMEKKNMRQEMGKSPDRADAFALTFYDEEYPEFKTQTERNEEYKINTITNPFSAI